MKIAILVFLLSLVGCDEQNNSKNVPEASDRVLALCVKDHAGSPFASAQVILRIPDVLDTIATSNTGSDGNVEFEVGDLTEVFVTILADEFDPYSTIVDCDSARTALTVFLQRTLVGNDSPLDCSLETIAGDTFELSSLANSVVLITFWAAWCGPCLQTIERMVELDSAYFDIGVRIVGINTWESDSRSRDELETLLANFGVGYINLVNGELDTCLHWSRYGLPTTLVVDRTGALIQEVRGYLQLSEWQEIVEPLLAP